MSTETLPKPNESEILAKDCYKFVTFVIENIKVNQGVRAAFTRADNPNTQYQCWEFLHHFCDLEDEGKVTCFATVGAVIARHRITHSGKSGFGSALRLAFGNDPESDPAKSRLRRILACDDRVELCSVIRSSLQLIHSKGVTMNYPEFLKDLIFFNQKTKCKWASDFYKKGAKS